MVFIEQFEKGGHNALELMAVDGFVAIDVQKVEDVLDVVDVRDIASDQVNEGLHHFGELLFGEAVILVLVEFRENFFVEGGNVTLGEFTRF